MRNRHFYREVLSAIENEGCAPYILINELQVFQLHAGIGKQPVLCFNDGQ